MIKQCQHLRNYQPFVKSEKQEKLIIGLHQDEQP